MKENVYTLKSERVISLVKRLHAEKARMKLERTYNDDFSWLNLPTLPEEFSFKEMLSYALKNTDFRLHERNPNQHQDSRIEIHYNLKGDYVNVISFGAYNFTKENILQTLNRCINHVELKEELDEFDRWCINLYQEIEELVKTVE